MNQPANPRQGVIDSVFSLRDEWPAICGDHRLNFEAEADWTLSAAFKNEYAEKAALGNPNSVMMALRNVGYIGLSLDPAQKLAYVLPRDGAMVYECSYMGLIHIAVSSNSILWAQAAIVYEKDTFELRGYDEAPIHRRNPFDKERGAIIGAYVVAKTHDGSYLTTPMSVDELNAIRDRSPAWKNKKQGQAGGPWATDWPEMAKKSCVKQAYKYWPRSERLDKAIHYLNTEGGQGIDLTPEAAAKSKADALIEDVKAATSGTAVATVWQRARTDEELKADPDAYARVREAVAARNRELGVQPKPATGPVATPAPTLPPAMSPEAKLMQRIETAANFKELEDTGPGIDALPADLQAEFNDAYNQRLEALKKGQK